MMTFFKRIFTLKNLFHFTGVVSLISLLLAYLNPFIHPSTFGWLSIIGLTYPLIVIFNLLYLVIAIIFKSRWALIIGALLILGIRFHLRIIAVGHEQEATGSYDIKIVSYNTQVLGRYNPDKQERFRRRNGIIDYLINEDADIMCFQEFYHQDPPTDFITRDSIIQKLEIKDYHERFRYRLTNYKNFGIQNVGVCILSKFPIIKKGNVNFDLANKTSNFCIYVDIVAHQDTFRIYNAHLQSLHLELSDDGDLIEGKRGQKKEYVFHAMKRANEAFPIRANQAEAITKHIKSCPYPVIVCGDFNDTPMSYSYQQFSSFLTDAFWNSSFGLGATYSGTLPAGRIDYIFHSQSLQSTNFEIQKEKLSDHYAISCRIYPKQID